MIRFDILITVKIAIDNMVYTEIIDSEDVYT